MSRAGRVSFGIIVPYQIWVTHRQVYSNRLTRQAPFASEKCLLLPSGSVDLLGSSEQHLMLEGKFASKFAVLLIFTDSHSTSLVMLWFLHLFSISLCGLFAGIPLGGSHRIESSLFTPLLFVRSSAAWRCQRGMMSPVVAAAVAATENSARNVSN